MINQKFLIIDPFQIFHLFSKIFERLMYNNVFNFMNEKELIYNYQFGFRQKHSTQAIISLVDKITKILDSGDIVIVFFIGFEKTIDTVNHKII